LSYGPRAKKAPLPSPTRYQKSPVLIGLKVGHS